MEYEHECDIGNAPKFAEWIRTRGGVAVWRSVNLSNPGASWSTPACVEGEPHTRFPKPTWQAANEPEKIVTDAARIKVIVPREVKRFLSSFCKAKLEKDRREDDENCVYVIGRLNAVQGYAECYERDGEPSLAWHFDPEALVKVRKEASCS